MACKGFLSKPLRSNGHHALIEDLIAHKVSLRTRLAEVRPTLHNITLHSGDAQAFPDMTWHDT